MTASTATSAGIAPRRAGPLARTMGLGSVFGKTLRDSRRAMLIVGGLCTLMYVVSAAALGSTFGTVELRLESASLSTSLPPIITGLYGGTQPNIVALGGFTGWRYGFIFFLLPGFWSLLAMSSTLVNEERRGSMDLIASTPLARRTIAIQKLSAHMVAMAVAMLVVALVAWAAAAAFGTLSADEIASIGGTGSDAIPIGAALANGLLMWLFGIATGAIAFAVAPFAGRGAAAGIAGLVMAASWIVYGYRESIPLFDALNPLSWYAWTSGFRPLAGTFDWLPLLGLVAVIVVGAVVGVIAFERRDLGAVGTLRLPGLPAALRGTGSPFGRSLSDRLTPAIWWGIGIGLYALLVAASGDQLRDSIANTPAVRQIFEAAFPSVDLAAPGFGLQLAFLSFGYLMVAIAASMLIGAWGADEGEGRLEMVLATATAPARWYLLSGLGVLVSIAIVVVIIAAGAAVGVLATGDDPSTPLIGSATLALYPMALAGVAFAVGGLLRTGLASVVVMVLAVATLLLDIIVPALKLPDWMRDLALTSHYGQPMLGQWDGVGIVVSAALAVGGLVVGALAFARRDLRG